MGARRFFVSGARAPGELVEIDRADARKIRSVLRLGVGDELEIVDSAGAVFSATIERADGDVAARLIGVAPHVQKPRLSIDVAQGIPKGQKLDFVVEKLSELGVNAILPLKSQRVEVSPGDGKIERWRRLAKSAAAQSARHDILTIAEPIDFPALIERFAEYDLVLFPWEVAAATSPLRKELPALLERAARMLIVIGPEGGFSHDEAERAVAAGARVISLGPRILRTETAALVTVAIVQYICE